jgi:hypothetical protein
LFFPLLWLKRRWLPKRDPLLGDFGKPRPFGNRLLHTLLAAERFPLRYLDFPFGATLIVLARKPV